MHFTLRILATAILALSPYAFAGDRPNVIVVMTDDQGWGDLSASGNPHLKTPHLDRLRAEGMDFENFIASPTCSPTRAALLSGLHEFRCGISHTNVGRSWIRPDVPLMPEILGKAGYQTAIIGKWHLGESLPCRPEDRGFQSVFIHGGGGIGQTPDRWGNDYVDPWVRTREGWRATKGYCTHVFFEEAGRWIKERAEDKKPFYLHLATNAPHDPYIAPAGTARRFIEAGVAEPVASFYAMIEDIDAAVGRLLDQLDTLGLAENTIVIFLGDNGSSLAHWTGGMKGRKCTTHEGGVRAPCFIRWPGKIAAGRVTKEPVTPLDLLPTLAKLTGTPMPDGWKGDGLDLSAVLLGEGVVPSDRMIFSHVGRWRGDEMPERHRSNNFSVREGRWLLQGLELFDLETDPGQKSNVFEKFPDDASRLLTGYGQWWDSVLPMVREPVRPWVGDARQPVVLLSAHDWWPSRETDGAISDGLAHQRSILNRLNALAAGKPAVAQTSGHWKLHAAREGNYRVTLSMLPPEAPAAQRDRLGQLKAGTVHLRAGRREVQTPLLKTATSVSLHLDLNEGDFEMEGWFTGQLPGQGILGAFYATVERVGERRVPDIEFEIQRQPKK